MKKNKLDKYLKFSIAIVLIYTLIAILYQFISQTELSATLTTAVYAFFGTEIGACAFIKIFSKGEGDNKDDND